MLKSQLRDVIREEIQKIVSEGSMSDIDIVAQESKNITEFTNKIKKEYPKMFPGGKVNASTKTWLKQIYTDAKDRG